jgi:hypothetical protein
MSDEAAFETLIEQLRSGDEEAAQRVFDQFAHRLLGLARRASARPSAARKTPRT